MPHINVLRTALTEVSNQIKQTKYPDIVFPQFVFVDQSGNPLMDEKLHFSADVTGDLDSGLITYNTNNFEQVDVKFNHTRSPVVTWAKTVQWQEIELAKAAALGVKVDMQKLMALNQNAQQTLQKVAFLGHGVDARLKGLLNADNVEVYKPKKAPKKVGAMTFDESVQFFEELFLRAMEKTYRIQTPNTFALDSMDYAHLGLTTRDNAINETTALEHLIKKLSGAAGKAVHIKALPSNFGEKADGKHRAIAYINDRNYVSMDVPQSPTVLGAAKKGLMTYESGLKMVFGGVTFHEPDSALYVDY